ncbi:MAG: M56 family metallopeptidase [Gemmatimonadales bacterium]
MIAAWMAAATLLAVLLGLAALAAERALRVLGREARGVWLTALVAAVGWPVVAPAASNLLSTWARDRANAASSVASSVAGTVGAGKSSLPAVWALRVDAILLLLWAVASIALLVRLVLALRAISRVERSATAQVVAGVPVLVTPSLGPAVFGARRPRVLVPRWLLDLDAPLRTLVLRHEEEHCRARDPQVALAVALVTACVPWNAGAWWIARRLRLAVELDCDSRVLRGTAEPERYGRLLLLIAQRQSQALVAPMLAESNSHLSRRIAAMSTQRPANAATRAAILLLAAAGALACATRPGADLTSPPSVSGRTLASLSPAAGPTYVEFQVDKQVIAAPGSAAPRYPSILRTAGVEGEVLAMFVVDSAGLAEPTTLKIVHSTHELFTNAVRNALPDMRFVAAQVQGRKVKQLIQQPFVFAIALSDSGALAKIRAGLGSTSAEARPVNPANAVRRLDAIIITATPLPAGSKAP